MSEAKKQVFTPDVVISLRLVEQMSQGKSVKEAIDAICGVGTFEKLAGDLYDQLRAKGA